MTCNKCGKTIEFPLLACVPCLIAASPVEVDAKKASRDKTYGKYVPYKQKETEFQGSRGK